MLRPVIFIGCGGAGVKTVRLIREQCQRTLERAGWRNGIPKAWQFIGIDSLTTSEEASIPYLPPADYVNISRGYNRYQDLWQAVEVKFGHDTNPRGFKELQGWRPNLMELAVPINQSARQLRAVGRTVGILALQDSIQGQLKNAFVQCTAGGPELAEVCRQLQVNVPLGTPVPNPLTIIVGSMAGATGSGIMLDVVDLVRRTDAKGAFPVLIAYTPDIFGAVQDKAMIANSAAFMAELLSAYWDDESTDCALIPGSVAVRGGPHSIFLVGRRNMDGLDLWDTKNVYRTVAETLTRLMTSVPLQTSFCNFYEVVWTSWAWGNSGGYGFRDHNLPGVASSFGSVTISIGRDRFRDYLAKLIHRSIVEHLTNGFEAAAASEFGDASKSMPRPTKIFELVQRRQAKFAIACGLHESIEGPRLISDRFVSREIMQTRSREVFDKLRSPFAGARQRSSEWQLSLTVRAAEVRDAELVAMENELNSGLREWGTAILEKILRATTEVSGTCSFPVALELLHLLRAQVLETSSQMRDDAERSRDSAKAVAKRAQSQLGGEAPGILSVDNPAIHEIIQDLSNEIVLEWSARVREKLALALQSVATDVLSSLEGTVNQALSRMQILTNTQDGRPAEVSYWPRNDGVVPSSFAPSPTEFLLEEEISWPETVRSLLKESLGDPSGLPIDPVEATRLLIIRGGYTCDATKSVVAPLVWATTTKGPLEWEPGQKIQIMICDGLEALATRIDEWLTRPHTAIRRFVTERLATYLLPVDVETGAEIPEHQQRLTAFRQTLQVALAESRPLVEIDTVLNTQVHPNPLRLNHYISGFPFGVGHPARGVTSQMIQGFLNTAEAVDWAFSPEDAESVLIASFLAQPVNPSVVTSFTKPFAEALATVSPQQLRTSFWHCRRARTLENFIPLPDDLRIAAIRGFAVARILGTVTASPDGKNQISTRAGVLNFPPYFLTETDRNNVLPALLEAMILAFADVPTRGMAAFEAYGALINYGLGGGSTIGFEIEGLAARVLESGDYSGIQIVDEARANALKNDPNGRIANAITYIDANLQWFDTLDAKPLDPRSWRNFRGTVDPVDTMTRELVADLRSGYLMVREAIERFEWSLSNPPQSL